MEGLIKDGNEILFLSHYAGDTEDYNYIMPVIVGYSPLSNLLFGIIGKIKKWSPEQLSLKKMKSGFPRYRKLYQYIKDFRPDIAILRERSVYTIYATRICRRLKIPTILYNQSPLWDLPPKNDLAHRIVRSLTPEKRMTPVSGTIGDGKMIDSNSYFVPFVMPLMFSPEQKKYNSDGILRILTIGKYKEQKNYFMMIDAISDLMNYSQGNIHLTIVGECASEVQEDYFRRLEKKISECKLNENVILYKNLNREEVFREYEKADLFIIAAIGEVAGISMLEAMAHSLPVICSDTDGSSCYVEYGVNGYIAIEKQRESLTEALIKVYENIAQIPAMGAASYDIIANKCCFNSYFDSIIEITKEKV